MLPCLSAQQRYAVKEESDMIKLQLPLKKEDIAQLRAGDEVLLTGPV